MKKHLLMYRLVALFVVLALGTPTVYGAPPSRLNTGSPAAQGTQEENSGLYRTAITVRNASDWTRLERLGIAVLDRQDDSATVLADDDQLETLARLRFEPKTSDELSGLLHAQGPDKAWLQASLQALVDQGDALQAILADKATAAEAVQPARSALRSAINSLTAEQRAGVASSSSLDDDADGLTNTQEAWWCSDPLNTDTDSDGRSDGVEIQALKDWIANRRAGPPGETPWPNWPFNGTTCPDKDHDSIPNLAERWELGLDMDLESSDRDRYDDGQEVFGTTYCPGSASACGYGQLPSANHDGILLFPHMPSWVTAPGNHPLVAGLPRLAFSIVPAANGSEFTLQTATVVTTDERHEQGETKSYSTTKTDGTSTSDAETETWENWQEYSKTTEAGAQSNAPDEVQSNSSEQLLQMTNVQMANVRNSKVNVKVNNTVNQGGGSSLASEISAPATSFIVDEACAELGCRKYIGSGIRASVRTFAQVVQGTLLGTSDVIQNEFKANNCDPTSLNPGQILCRVKSTGTLWKKNYDEKLGAATAAEQEASGVVGGNYLQTGPSTLDISRIFPISFPEPRFIPTETNTTGSSSGGARTTTQSTYQEHAVTEGTAHQFGQSWGTATAENSVHAADLWFAYKLSNIGNDYARVICNLAINIYIGDPNAPAATYFPGNDLGGNGCFSNFQPGESHTYSFPSQSRIALTLDQMAAIDQGGAVRFVIEDYSLGQDDYYADDAVGANVQVAIEDGIADGDEDIDNYLIPTWSDETVLDILARYFPHTTDVNGMMVAIWTPEYRQDTPGWCDEPRAVGAGNQQTLWCKHALSTVDWWNIYTNGMGDGSEGFQDTPASPGSVALFRFNKDSDLDGYSDRSEERLGTDPADPADYPRPEPLAGVHSTRTGNHVAATLSLLNTGIYDAYGIEAVMIAPNDTITITNNTVGGSGRVRAQNQVVVGSRILPQSPLPAPWTQAGHAKPAPGGYYTGTADRTYTFTVQCSNPGGCGLGSGTWTVGWNDGAGATGSLNFGSGYASPTLLDVGAFGVKLGLLSGTAANGEIFTVQARTPRDTFQYDILQEPFTPPIVLVSYNDPQGNHRLAIPPAAMALTSPTADLMAYAGQMLPDPGVEIVTSGAFAPGANTTTLEIVNPTETTLSDAHLFLEFINISGTVVSEVDTTVANLPPGPTMAPVVWDTADFDPAYSPDEDYIVMAFWTDYAGNILDTGARPLSSFQTDPAPVFAMTTEDETWDFGTVQQGTILKRNFAVANTGLRELLTYVIAATGLSLTQVGSRHLPPGDITTYTITLDTRALLAGPYDNIVTIRTNDSVNPERVVHVTGTVETPSGQAHVFTADPYRPWDRRVFVPGSHQTRDQIDFDDDIVPDSSVSHPLYVYDFERQSRLGTGRKIALIDLQLGGMVNAPIAKVATEPMTATIGETNEVVATGVDLPESSPPWWNGAYLFRRQIFLSGYQAAGTTVKLNAVDFNQLQSLGKVRPDKADVRIVRFVSGSWQEVARNYITEWDVDFKLLSTLPGSDDSYWLYYGNPAASSPPTFGAAGQGWWVDMYHDKWCSEYGGTWAFNEPMNYNDVCESSLDHDGRIGSSFDESDKFRGRLFIPTTGTWTFQLYTNDGYRVHLDGAEIGHFDGYTGNRWVTVGSAYLKAGWYKMELRNMWVNCGAWKFYMQGPGFGNQLVPANYFQLLWEDSPALSVGVEVPHTGSISGLVFADLNNNGVKDTGETGIGGITVSLDGTGQTRTTNGNGNYTFTDINPGGYTVSISVPAGYVNTTVTSRSVSLDPGGTSTADFGLLTYMLEKLSGTDHSIRLFSPEPFSGGRGYWLQFGREVALGAGGSQIAYARLPKEHYATITLKAIFAQASSGGLTLGLDVGDNNSIDWTGGSTTIPGTILIPNLAQAFNDYLASQPSGDVDVPIRVSLSTSGQLFLTELVAAPAVQIDTSVSSGDISFSAATPTEGDEVTVTATLHNLGSRDSGPLTASFFATLPSGQEWYIGSDFVSSVSPSSPSAATLPWNTLGFTGAVPVRVVIDPYNRVAETNENNNQASKTLTILTRPDLKITAIDLSDDEPVVGQAVDVVVTVQNNGQTAASSSILALYDGMPDTGGSLVCDPTLAVSVNGTTTATCTWTLSTLGLHRLVAFGDRDGMVNESDESNNSMWVDVYAGFQGPILLDSGNAPADPTYSPTTGYGVVDVGPPDVPVTCGDGSAPEDTLRRDPNGKLLYRFDHLLPGHFYHLDVTLRECDGNARQESVYVDGNQVAEPVNLGDSQAHFLSMLLDPALYADHAISVTVEALVIADGALVGEVNLYDIDYRYADAGGDREPQYPGSQAYGWLEGDSTLAWGSLPYQSARINQGGNQERYRFDGLQAGKRYVVNLTFYQSSGAGRQQRVEIDGQATGLVVNTGDYTVHRERVFVPGPSYSSDGSIVVGVVRTDAGITGAMVNEISLEELTVRSPDIVLSPASLTATQAQGLMGSQPLEVGNTGTANLNWTITEAPTDCASPGNVAWLSVSPASGTTEAGGSTALTVSLDSRTLSPATYNAKLCVASDDPDQPLVFVPVQLTVTPATNVPRLSIPTNVPGIPYQTVTMPVQFARNGTNIASLVFSVDYDQTCLQFDPTDSDGDGVPDAVTLSIPAAFQASATFDAADTDGELDFFIADTFLPLSALPDGTPATIQFRVICQSPPGNPILARVGFSTNPTVSFGSTNGSSVPGVTSDGSVEVQSVAPGDCNADIHVDAGDISAVVLEIFDGDGSDPAAVPGGTFLGSSVGCNANQDTWIDAGDISCTVLIIFNGPNACGGLLQPEVQDLTKPPVEAPALTLLEPKAEGDRLIVPISFKPGGNQISSLVFAVDYDPTVAGIDPTDADGNGIPDAVALNLPPEFQAAVIIDQQAGQLRIMIADVAVPLAALPEKVIATVTWQVKDGRLEAANLRFSQTVPASFGEIEGRSITGSASAVPVQR